MNMADITVQKLIDGIELAATFKERERCAKIAEEWDPDKHVGRVEKLITDDPEEFRTLIVSTIKRQIAKKIRETK